MRLVYLQYKTLNSTVPTFLRMWYLTRTSKISSLDPISTPGVFCTCFYNHNHAHRLCLETLLYQELFRSPNGHFKPLLDSGGGFQSETAVK
jgi:hypothetical protein